jgi:putative addiction module component (TIGR02574 family)
MASQQAILAQAMQLSREQRAEVARELIASLDEPAEPDVESAWLAEVERRLHAVDSGASATLPWEVVRERITARLRPTRK